MKKILVIGHSFVVDSNRMLWNKLGQQTGAQVDLVVPNRWKSNLVSKMRFEYNPQTDNHLSTIYPLTCFFKGRGSFFFFNPFTLWIILFKEKYDLIILAQETWSISLLQVNLLKILTSNRQSKFALWICQNIKKQHLFFLRHWERINTSSLHVILGCCHETKEVICWKGIKKPWYYLPFSFDETLYQHSKLMFNKEKIVLGFIGRISEEKGVLLLLEAYKKLREKNIIVELVLAGTGPLVKIFDGIEGVTYLGVLTHQEAHLFYQKIDCLVLPSQTKKFWKEQFGRVIIESVSSYRPVVGSSSGAIPEVMAQVGMPYVFQESSLTDLCAKIEQVMADIKSNKMSDLIKESKKRCMESYSHQSVAQKISLV